MNTTALGAIVFDPTSLFAFVRALAFAATVPMAGSRTVPSAIRVVLAVTLVPALVAHEHIPTKSVSVAQHTAEEAVIGAAFGVAASIVAAAASAAGSVIDGVLSARALDREPLFGVNDGPFARLYGLAFGWSFLATGAFTHLCSRFVGASMSVSIDTAQHTAVDLVRASTTAALALAAPAITGQVVATLIAAAAARAAPRINGLVLASPLVTVIVLMTGLAGLASTIPTLIRLAGAAASASPL